MYRAIDSGANAIAEGFLFGVAAALILGESYRSSRSQAKRRDVVDDQIDDLKSQVQELSGSVKKLKETFEERWSVERHRFVFCNPKSLHHSDIEVGTTS